MDDRVYFTCVRERGKLRIKVINNPYYNSNANCQFPRDIRAEGRVYSAPARAVSFAQSSAGTVFYRVARAAIRIEAAAAVVPAAVRVFDVGDETCCVCMESAKDVVYIPCGHFCCCAACAGRTRACPYCRAGVAGVVNAAEID